MNHERILRFGVIGCGRMGQRRIAAIVEHPQAELVSVYDVKRELAERTAAGNKCLMADDYREITSREDIDCVVISTPNKYHLEITKHAAQAGKHIFCEKPLASSPTEAMAMVSAAEAAGVTLTTGSNLRYFPSTRKAYELLQAGAIGETVFLRSWIGHQGWNLNESWFSDPFTAGGGTFLDNGCHVLDITRWFLGEVKSCVGQVQTSVWKIEPLEDNGYAIFETTMGKTAFIQSSWTEWNGYNYLEVYGTNGYIRVDNRGRKCLTALGNRDGEEEIFDYSSLPANSYRAEFENYMDVVRSGGQPLPSGQDGMRAVQMAFAVYESAKTGRRIEVDPRYTGAGAD